MLKRESPRAFRPQLELLGSGTTNSRAGVCENSRNVRSLSAIHPS